MEKYIAVLCFTIFFSRVSLKFSQRFKSRKSDGGNEKKGSGALFVNEHFPHINTPEFGFTSARTQRG